MCIKLIICQCSWLLLIPLLVGCGAVVTNATPTQLNLSVRSTATVVVVSPTRLSTETPSSPMPSLQPTATPSVVRPTPLPVARLELDAAKKKFDVLDQNADCRLPCFNGLTPGISANWEAQDFFANLGFDRERDAQGRWILSDGEANLQSFEIPYLISSNLSGRPNLSVAFQNEKVSSIAIGFLPYRQWVSIPRFLSAIDETPQIILSEAVGGESAINRFFYLMFVFSKQQLEVVYRIPDLSRSFQAAPVCMSSDIPADVYIILGKTSVMSAFCESCDPTMGHEWSKQLDMKPEDLRAIIRDGDFCLPLNNQK